MNIRPFLSVFIVPCVIGLVDTVFASSEEEDLPFHNSSKEGKKVKRKKNRNHHSSHSERKKNSSVHGKENVSPQTNVSSPFKGEEASQPKEADTSEKPKSLLKALKQIEAKISQSYKEENPRLLLDAYESFKALNYKNRQWREFGEKCHVYKWPSQKTWKEAVGGFLYFPQEALEWEVTPGEEYRLKHRVALRRFAFAAKFNHLLGQHYLAKTLDEIRSGYTNAKNSSFFKKLNAEALEALRKCPDSPEACYILGSAYSTVNHPFLKYNLEEALAWHKKGGDLRNQLQILLLRKHNKNQVSPEIEEYISLGEGGYMRAYLEASQLVEGTDEELKILSKAVEKGYLPALRWQGVTYEDHYDQVKAGIRQEQEESKPSVLLKKARKFYKQAGKKGYPQAFVDFGKTYVKEARPRSLEKKKHIESLPASEINKAIDAFTRAGEAQHPEGWTCLAGLYLVLHDKADNNEKLCHLEKKKARWTKKKQEYATKAYEAYENGMALGSSEAYHQVYSTFPKEFERLVEKYGPAPQEGFREAIKEFLQEAN